MAKRRERRSRAPARRQQARGSQEVKATKVTRTRATRHAVSHTTRRSREATPAQKYDPRFPTVLGIRISHPDRLIYPDLGISKIQLARYYEAIAEWIASRENAAPTAELLKVGTAK